MEDRRQETEGRRQEMEDGETGDGSMYVPDIG
jgi:hypothetical protein